MILLTVSAVVENCVHRTMGSFMCLISAVIVTAVNL